MVRRTDAMGFVQTRCHGRKRVAQGAKAHRVHEYFLLISSHSQILNDICCERHVDGVPRPPGWPPAACGTVATAACGKREAPWPLK